MNCPFCGEKIPEGYRVTCGDSYCSEVSYVEQKMMLKRTGSKEIKTLQIRKNELLRIINQRSQKVI